MISAVRIVGLLLGLVLAACSTNYGSEGLTGGYEEKELEPGVWRVAFAGNGFTSGETVQTYWLNRSAELTLQKGYDGFQIVSNMNLSRTGEPGIQVAAGSFIYVPVYAVVAATSPRSAATSAC